MTLSTVWGDALDPQRPLPEYPRPQLVREGWTNLNGVWDLAVRPFSSPDPLDVSDPTEPPAFDGTIVVPFSPEVPLSGVGHDLTKDEVLWYRRSFTQPAVAADERVLLHFGAVDQTCRVAVDGTEGLRLVGKVSTMTTLVA